MTRYLYAISAALSWGLAPVMAKLSMSEGLSFIGVAVLSSLLALPPYYVLTVGTIGRAWKVPFDAMPMVAASGLLNAVAVLGLFWAVTLAPISVVTIVTASCTPILTFFLSRLFLRRERIGRELLLGTVLVIAGIYLVVS